jgi:hypothetical protein
MAAVRKSPVKKVKFELTKSAICGIAVIAFCLFLWMFLLGVWAGQSLLLPNYGAKVSVTGEKGRIVEPPVIKAEKKIVKKTE